MDNECERKECLENGGDWVAQSPIWRWWPHSCPRILSVNLGFFMYHIHRPEICQLSVSYTESVSPDFKRWLADKWQPYWQNVDQISWFKKVAIVQNLLGLTIVILRHSKTELAARFDNWLARVVDIRLALLLRALVCCVCASFSYSTSEDANVGLVVSKIIVKSKLRCWFPIRKLKHVQNEGSTWNQPSQTQYWRHLVFRKVIM